MQAHRPDALGLELHTRKDPRWFRDAARAALRERAAPGNRAGTATRARHAPLRLSRRFEAARAGNSKIRGDRAGRGWRAEFSIRPSWFSPPRRALAGRTRRAPPRSAARDA